MTEMLDGLLRWWPLPFMAAQAVMGWMIWSLNQQFVKRGECDKLRGNCGRRLAELEKGSYTAPSRPEIQTLVGRIDQLAAQISKLDGKMGGINRVVDLLNEHHLRGNG